MTYETITVKPLAGALGAEIGGVDLREPLSNRQRSEIHDAFLAHCAIYIRGQELGGADLLRYARYFAEPAYYPFVEGMPDFPQIFELRKEPDMTVNVGGAWHSDTTYLDKPPIGTMLYARKVPAYGGDTMVANQYLAYETLSAGMRKMLNGLTGIYSAHERRARRARREQVHEDEGHRGEGRRNRGRAPGGAHPSRNRAQGALCLDPPHGPLQGHDR
jgi:taurine dioxygenase